MPLDSATGAIAIDTGTRHRHQTPGNRQERAIEATAGIDSYAEIKLRPLTVLITIVLITIAVPANVTDIVAGRQCGNNAPPDTGKRL